MIKRIHTNASQCAQILEHFKTYAYITTPTARSKFKCERLASRIRNLREEGHNIITTMHKTDEGKRYAVYALKRGRK